MADIKDQICAMLKYLYDDQHIWNATIYQFDPSTKILEILCTSEDGFPSEEWCLENAHRILTEDCRKRAHEHWVDIELANAGLFWCTYE